MYYSEFQHTLASLETRRQMNWRRRAARWHRLKHACHTGRPKLSYKSGGSNISDRQAGYRPQEDPLHRLSLEGLTDIFRLQIGHCCLTSHLGRIRVAESAVCDCGEGDQTPEHVLQACPLLDQLRHQTWPTNTTLDSKLWGSLTICGSGDHSRPTL